MAELKRRPREAFLLMGLDVKRVRPGEHLDRLAWLKNQGIKTVLDVGANSGQFALSVNRIVPEARIYSFEPLRDVYESLVSNMAYVPGFRAFDCALGLEDGETTIRRSAFSPASSSPPMTDLQRQAFPYTRGETTETVKVRRLDGILGELDCPESILIKIDVQGFEDKVILGGQKLVSGATVVIVETTFEGFYEGPSFATVFDILRGLGFSYHGALEQLRSPGDGRILQQDSVFLKDDHYRPSTSGDAATASGRPASASESQLRQAESGIGTSR